MGFFAREETGLGLFDYDDEGIRGTGSQSRGARDRRGEVE